MLENIKWGKDTKLVCYKLDRISCTENLDTTTLMGKAMVNIVVTFAQL